MSASYQVAASTDEALQFKHYVSTTYFAVGANEADFGNNNASYYGSGFGTRYSIPTPNSASVGLAYLKLFARDSYSTASSYARISAEKSDNAPIFSTEANFNSRYASKTTAVIDWNNVSAFVASTEYTSPNIAPVINEIVSRPGWTASSYIVLFCEDFDDRSNVGARRGAFGQGANAPKLVLSQVAITITPDTGVLKLNTFNPSSKSQINTLTASLKITSYPPEVDVWTTKYKIKVDWDNDGSFSEQYDDITSDIKSIRFSRGRDDELGKAQIGELTLTLKNETGKYTPSKISSPLFGKLLPRRTIQIRSIFNNTLYNLFYGFIEEIIPHPNFTEQDCIITALDGLDFLAKQELETSLYKGESTGTVIGHILDNIGWLSNKRSLDTGQDTIPYWYGHDILAKNAINEIEDSEQGFTYVNGSGNFCFEDREHRNSEEHLTSKFSFYDTMTQINYNLSAKNVYNNIKATVTPWTLQASTTLWTLGEVPVISPSTSLPIWGNSTVSGESVFVDGWNTPVASTDYKANTASTGLGVSLTHLMSVSVEKFAQAIKYDVFNSASVNAYLTLLQGRGTWYDSQNQFTLKSEDTNSESYYQKRTFSLDGKYITDSIHAQEFCDSTLAKYKNPHAEVSITIMNKNDTLMEQILTREISDRITVVNTKLGLSQDYSIDWMEHEITNSGLTHIVTYKLVNYYNKILIPNNTLKLTTYAPNEDFMYEYYNTVSTKVANSGMVTQYGQTFTTVGSHQISNIKSYLARQGNPGELLVGIRNTASGLPVGGDLVTGSTNANTLPDWTIENEWRDIAFSSAISLSASTQYAIVYKCSNTSSSEYLILPYNDISAYPKGNALIADTSSVWYISASRDYYFEVHNIV
jgi:hypothetical protein